MGRCEEDKNTKDSQIRTLRDEIAHQEDMIVKLGKEKKSAGEGRQKTEEDIQAAEDRCNHLSKVKGKLEQSLDECEDALEREKKAKGDVEKMKRKVEGDLKLTQEAVSDLERVNAELSQTVQRKEKEVSSISAKIEDEVPSVSFEVNFRPSYYHKQLFREPLAPSTPSKSKSSSAGWMSLTKVKILNKNQSHQTIFRACLRESQPCQG